MEAASTRQTGTWRMKRECDRLAWPWPFQDWQQSARGHGGGGAGPRPPRAGILRRPVRRRTEPVRLEGSWAGWGARGESSNSGYQAEAFGVSSL